MISSKTAVSSLGAIGINPCIHYHYSCAPPQPQNHALVVHHQCADGMSRSKTANCNNTEDDENNNIKIEIEIEWCDTESETTTTTSTSTITTTTRQNKEVRFDPIEWCDTESETTTTTSTSTTRTTARQNKEVRFDPNLNWKTETEKSEHGHIRRLAEREIQKRLILLKQHHRSYMVVAAAPTIERLSRLDRQREAFFYICGCDIDLLVFQYVSSTTAVLPRVFDWLFEDAGIKTLSERKQEEPQTPKPNQTKNSESTESDCSWLWASFLALQLRYRGLCVEGTNLQPPGRNAEQALLFIHWLSPVFRLEEKDLMQREVFSSILGERNTSSRFEAYLLHDRDEPEDCLDHLGAKVALFFETVFYPHASSSLPETIDLGACFAAIRGEDRVGAGKADDDSCKWALCQGNGGGYRLVYESLSVRSKRVLFWISAMPAYRAYKQKLGHSGLSSSLKRALDDCTPEQRGETNNSNNKSDIGNNCDCHEFTQEICNMLFEPRA